MRQTEQAVRHAGSDSSGQLRMQAGMARGTGGDADARMAWLRELTAVASGTCGGGDAPAAGGAVAAEGDVATGAAPMGGGATALGAASAEGAGLGTWTRNC